MIGQNKKILLLSPSRSSFVRNDYEILLKIGKVDWIIINKKSFNNLILNSLKALILVPFYDVLFIWFAAPQFFPEVILAKIFGKKIFVVIGGYDVAKIRWKNYKYGLQGHLIFKHIVLWILNFASVVLAVSRYTKRKAFSFAKAKNIKVVYNGIDVDKFKKMKNIKKENLVVTVATDIKNQWYIKGLWMYIKIARKMPQIKFVLVGKYKENDPFIIDNLREIPKNLKIYNFISQKHLIEIYSRAKVYAQLSLHESFGCALAEAMLCECVPVVTKNGAIPEIVSNTGYYTEYGNIDKTIKMIKKAINEYSAEKGKKARKRILEKFSMVKRKEKLTKILKYEIN